MLLLHTANVHHKSAPKRAALAVAATGALAMVLAGCSASAEDGEGKTTLSFFSWDNETVMAPVIDAFEEANPDITIEFSSAPPVADYISGLQTRLLSNSAADVFVIAAENKTNLIEGGYVEDLTDEPYMSVIPEFNKETYSADGKVYGASTASWAAGFLYNVDIFEAAGVDVPFETWDDVVDGFEQIKATGVTPYLEGGNAIPMLIGALTGIANDESGGTMDAEIFDGTSSFEEAWAEPLTKYSGLFEAGLAPSEIAGLTPEQVDDEFANGRVAVIGDGPWAIAGLREKNPELNMAYTGVPGDGISYMAGAASPGYAINSASDNKAAAHKFLEFLTSEEGVEIYQKQWGAITVTTNFTPPVDPAIEPLLPVLAEGHVYLPQIAWPRYQDALNLEAVAQLQLLALGQATPESVGKALDAKLAELGG